MQIKSRSPALAIRRRIVSSLAALALTVVASTSLGGCAASTHLRTSEYQSIAGRTYVVVGASSGFGRGIATRLGQYRANVVLAARRGDVREEVAAEVRAGGGQALVVPMDVGRPDRVEQLPARS
jgi:5,10-methylene-tetrahydrofolate dehydrogenase/methenyl tetrahydrofolate cyclohydrolase